MKILDVNEMYKYQGNEFLFYNTQRGLTFLDYVYTANNTKN